MSERLTFEEKYGITREELRRRIHVLRKPGYMRVKKLTNEILSAAGLPTIKQADTERHIRNRRRRGEA